MGGNENPRDHLKELLKRNQKLAQEIQKKSGQLDQLFGQQKDALRNSYKLCETKEDKNRPTDRSPPEPRSRSQPALIIVEDDADDFMLLKRALWKAGATARVWWAHSAAEALGILVEIGPSVAQICMVLDVQLPCSNGLDLVKQIRAAEHGAGVKVAFLTGLTDQATKARALAAGADAFYLKTVDPASLLEIARDLQKLAIR
jgi:CheY-like chemotaxis protein